MNCKKAKRLAALFLSLVFILAIFPASAYAATNLSKSDTYTGSDFTSNEALAEKLDFLFKNLVYHKTYHYFTTTGKAGASSGVDSVVANHPTIKGLGISTSKVAGSQCYGFAQFVYTYLFGKALGDYGYESQKKSETANRTQLSGADVTVKNVRAMLLKAVPGDIIQMYGSSGPHTMVFLKATANDGEEKNIYVLHCNWTYSKSLQANDVTIGRLSYSEIVSNFGTKISLYHAKNYESKYPGVKPRLRKTAAKEATCTEAGNSAYWYCTGCKQYFANSGNCHSKVIEKNSWIIPAKEHAGIQTEAIAATSDSAGNSTYYTCSVCGKYFSDIGCLQEIEEGSWIIPAVTSNLVVMSTLNGITVFWGPASGAAKYRVIRTVDGVSTNINVTGTSWTDTEVEPAETYAYSVQAQSAYGTYSEASEKKSLYYPLGIAVKVSGSKANVSWTAVSGATKYQVYRRPEIDGKYGAWELIYSAKGTSFVDSPGAGVWQYRVRAVVDGVKTAYSNRKKVTIS